MNLGLSLIPPHFAVAGLFIIGCFISVSMGTSVGTITALAPIAVGISKTDRVFYGNLCSCRRVRGQCSAITCR